MFKAVCVAAVVGLGALPASAAVMDVDVVGRLSDAYGIIRDEGGVVWGGQAVDGAIVTARLTYDTLLGSVSDYFGGQELLSGAWLSLPSAVSAKITIGGVTNHVLGLNAGQVTVQPEGFQSSYHSRDRIDFSDSNGSGATDHYISFASQLPILASRMAAPLTTPYAVELDVEGYFTANIRDYTFVQVNFYSFYRPNVGLGIVEYSSDLQFYADSVTATCRSGCAINPPPPAPVPLPASAFLLAAGLVALALRRRAA